MFRTLRFYHSFFKFLSTPSSRRATGAARHHATVPTYFYPRPPRGGRPTRNGQQPADQQFLSTPSARRATQPGRGFLHQRCNFYPRPPRGGRLTFHLFCGTLVLISIHALREEGDGKQTYDQLGRCAISIHALREEGDRKSLEVMPMKRISIHALREEGDAARGRRRLVDSGFLSTPSARRATKVAHTAGPVEDISIHALREEGDGGIAARRAVIGISIHALREEGDETPAAVRHQETNFYPRPPRGGRRSVRRFWGFSSRHFYPRPPRGGRLSIPWMPPSTPRFLSTPSARRATSQRSSESYSRQKISIHALREEGDRKSASICGDGVRFLSTPSARRATMTMYRA